MTDGVPTGVTVSPDVKAFLGRTPEPEFVEAFITDINGIARGKRLPAASLPRLYGKGLCLPASTLVLDVWGEEVAETGLIFETGDADHTCYPVPGSLRPLPWSERPGGQLLLQMLTPEGGPFPGDPRNILAGVVARLGELGVTPVVATELEFRLFDAEPGPDGRPRPPSMATRGGSRSQLFGLDELESLDGLFADIEKACEAQGLPADTLIAEQSEGQYEINLTHVADPLLAADQAVLLKRTIKACARRHGLVASFMAKPFGDQSGNGMHVHVSLVDGDQRNVFAGDEAMSTVLRHAVGGLLATMEETTAICAPHANSFRRFQPGSHVPMAPTWGVDNRTTALRLPLAEPSASRIEHRVAGADANPYLVVANVLAGIHYGITGSVEPPPQTRGSAYEQVAASLPDEWGEAIAAFERSPFVADYLGETYRRWFAACKRQERERLRRDVPASEYDAYLGTI
ncbi:glutamine synthetase family protein [Arhodomonas sp. AD133]|uniref:glutamine synthetase family protein n=1 Tax=Arhodomonas sp. AD133 TaxID=3415009 RepID=UPI003EB76AB6